MPKQNPASSTGKPTTSVSASNVVESDGQIPPWSTLPFEILLSIFDFASDPLLSPGLEADLSANWLVGAAHACEAFKEPALTCLYISPPIYSQEQSHKLLHVLKQTIRSSPMLYQARVKRLEIDADKVLSHTTRDFGRLDLVELVTHMPLLEDLIITNATDRPPFRSRTQKSLWRYPDSLFTDSDLLGQKRKVWHWNGQMFSQRVSSLLDIDAWLKSMHQLNLHQSLEKLSISNLTLDLSQALPRTTPKPRVSHIDPVTALGNVISPLRELKSLSLTSCYAEPWLPVLSHLPTTLTSFNITNSHTLDFMDLAPFLSSHGGSLKHIVLNHNSALGLQFLISLGQSCPKLQTLYMDTTLYAPFSTSQMTPTYDTLLAPSEKPTWPTTLESIELLHLQKWDSAGAETFFKSLLTASEELESLRRIIIKVSLSIGWRDRAGFRDKWIGRLHRVFLRQWKDPDPHLYSMKAYRLSKLPKAPVGTRATVTIADPPPTNGAESGDTTASPGIGTPTRRSRRTRTTTKAHTNSSDDSNKQPSSRPPKSAHDDADSTDEEQDLEDKAFDEQLHIQGLCTTVDITIDNLRPSEVQFTEGDFLDSEPSGDEDWNSDAEVDEDDGPGTGYAW